MKTMRPLHLPGVLLMTLLITAGCAKNPTIEAEPSPAVVTAPDDPADAVEQAIKDSQKPEEAATEIVLERVHFAFDQYTLSPQAREILDSNAAQLQSHAAAKIRIEGHCDDHGSDEYNLVLGERRAQAVSTYLQSLGVAADRLETISYGEEMPLDPARTASAWAKNRRAEFRILN